MKYHGIVLTGEPDSQNEVFDVNGVTWGEELPVFFDGDREKPLGRITEIKPGDNCFYGEIEVAAVLPEGRQFFGVFGITTERVKEDRYDVIRRCVVQGVDIRPRGVHKCLVVKPGPLES